MSRHAVCLVVLVAGLLAVGVVSRTPLRHLVQALPALTIVALPVRRTAWAADAAVPVFAIWLALMSAIWLSLLGVAHLVGGRFPPVEIALTVVIGVASGLGLVAAARGSRARWPVRVAAALALAVLQIGALWVSFLPGLATM